MNSDLPFEGDVPGDGDEAPYQWLDEWLCEYVDGTMDPSLEAVFEQYVDANPELKAHVKRLKQTRDLLCECGLPTEPSETLESDICADVECEMMMSSTPVSDVVRARPLAAAGVVSSVAIALVVGFLVGATMVEPPSSGIPASSPTESVELESQSLTPRMQHTRTTARPLVQRSSGLPFGPTDSTHQSFSPTMIGLR